MQVVTQPSGVKVYQASIASNRPNFIDAKKKKIKKNAANDHRLELIQDLEFPSNSQRIKQTSAGDHILATGTYAPQVRCYDLNQLSLKFQRNLACEVIQFEILSQDYTKLVFLRADRYLEFHTAAEKHYEIRIPKIGRDIAYQSSNCDLLSVGASNEIYRLNLEQGSFLKPMESEHLPEINTININPVHELICVGGINGKIECWDPKQRKSLYVKEIGSVLSSIESAVTDVPEITHVKFDNDGLTLGVGTSSGHTLIFDIRSSKPLAIKDHYYGNPIRCIRFHEKKLLVADSKILKIWETNYQETEEDKVWASIETPSDINDFYAVPQSGVVIFALEQQKLPSYFIPALGPAPKWCSFLENLTEELEEQNQQLYRDFKFVTKEELAKLGLTKYIGTDKVKAYMHGYFIDFKMYQKFKAIIEPFDYNKYKEEKAKETLAKESENRIRLKQKMPKVNAKMAARMLKEGKDKMLADDRFGDMFTSEDYRIDESHERFKQFNTKKTTITDEDLQEHFEQVDDQDEDQTPEEEDEEDQEEDEDEEVSDSEDDKPKKKIQFFEIKTGHENLLRSQSFDKKERALTFEERLKQENTSRTQPKVSVFGDQELTFTPESVVKKKQSDQAIAAKKTKEWKEKSKEKRGINSLPLQKLPNQGQPFHRRK